MLNLHSTIFIGQDFHSNSPCLVFAIKSSQYKKSHNCQTNWERFQQPIITYTSLDGFFLSEICTFHRVYFKASWFLWALEAFGSSNAFFPSWCGFLQRRGFLMWISLTAVADWQLLLPVVVSRPGVTVGLPALYQVPPPGVGTNSKLRTCAMHARHQLDAQKWENDAQSGCRKLIIQIDEDMFTKSGNQGGGSSSSTQTFCTPNRIKLIHPAPSDVKNGSFKIYADDLPGEGCCVIAIPNITNSRCNIDLMVIHPDDSHYLTQMMHII